MIIRKLTPILLVLLAYLSPAADAREQPKLGHQLTELSRPIAAPDFTLQDMDEKSHRFSDFRGRVVILNFWATWCPPCRREMPSMQRLYDKYRDDGFTVIAVNQMEDPGHVFAFIGQLDTDPTFPMLFDPDSGVSQAYGVKGLPTTFLVDKRGRIRYRAIGGREFDHPEVEAQIEKLMNE